MNCNPLPAFQKACQLAELVRYWGRRSPLCVFVSMTEWSGSEFTYHSSAASNQVTKPKSRRVHIIQQTLHQHCTDDNCNPLAPFENACYQALKYFCIQWSHKGNIKQGLHNPTKHTPIHVNFNPLPAFQKACQLAELVRYWGRLSPLCVLLSMTEWSGSELTYHSSAASNQATKPKLCKAHIIQQKEHKHCTDDNCNPLAPFENAF